MVNVALHPETTFEGSSIFDLNRIALRSFQTYLLSFLLYLTWKFALVDGSEELKDPILRKAVPPPVYL